MKPVAEWDEAYILSLPVGEFDWLEVKGRRSLDLTLPNVAESAVLETLSKELSALANSGGGTLVYGLSDPKPGDVEWHVDNGGVAVGVKRNGTREWLETVIPHQMEPALERFNVYAVPPSAPQSQIGAGRALFVIEIPDSQQAPHQATDKRYYARVGSRARPIGHRLIVDIMNRRQHPKLELGFRMAVRNTPMNSPHYVARTVHLTVTATNVARVYAEYVTVAVFLPESAALQEDEVRNTALLKREKDKGVAVTRDGEAYRRYDLKNLNGTVFEPLLPTLSYTWEIEMGGKALPRHYVRPPLLWQVFADHSVSESGTLPLSGIPLDGE